MTFRGIQKYSGNKVIFTPQSFAERVGNDGAPVFEKHSGLSWRSEIAEISASKYIGGAVLGFFSVCNAAVLRPIRCFIYRIDDVPDVDLTHWRHLDFKELQEVRYRRAVKARFAGAYTYEPEICKMLDDYYLLKSIHHGDAEVSDDEYGQLTINLERTVQYLLNVQI